MTGTLTFLLIGCLLRDVLGGEWNISMPENVEVTAGSPFILPCSFEIDSKHEKDLNSYCKVIWRTRDEDTSRSDLKLSRTFKKTGDLTQKNCTTFFNYLCPHQSGTYYLRLDCPNTLKYSFWEKPVKFSVKAVPPSLTLKPSSLEMKEGTSVSLSCSAPAVCLSHPPTLTWTSSLDDSQRTLQENQDKTEVVTSVLNFTASHLHHGEIISCSAVYRKPDGSPDEAVNKSLTAVISYSPKDTNVSVSPSGPVLENRTVTLTCSSHGNPPIKNYSWFRADGDQETFIGSGRVLGLKALNVKRPFFCKAENDLGDGRSNKSEMDVQFSPQILFSSGCIKTGDQISCSCETEGNPFPSVHWYFDGLPVNQSDKFAVSTESTNNKHLISIITVNQPHDRDLSTLLCRSFNSLGSASHQFAVNCLQDKGLWLVCLGTTSCILPILLLLVGVQMLFMGVLVVLLKFYKAKIQFKGEANAAAAVPPLKRERDEMSNIAEDEIYVNTSELPTHRAAVSHLHSLSSSDKAEGASKSSGKKGKDMIYSNMNWKSDER